jgi:hypothetical protein
MAMLQAITCCEIVSWQQRGLCHITVRRCFAIDGFVNGAGCIITHYQYQATGLEAMSLTGWIIL